MFTIDRNKFKTEIGRKYYDALKKIYDNEEFLLCMVSRVKGDQKRQKMINFMESSPRSIVDIIKQSGKIAHEDD